MQEKVLDFTVIIEQDEDGLYVATVPDIRGMPHPRKNSSRSLRKD